MIYHIYKHIYNYLLNKERGREKHSHRMPCRRSSLLRWFVGELGCPAEPQQQPGVLGTVEVLLEEVGAAALGSAAPGTVLVAVVLPPRGQAADKGCCQICRGRALEGEAGEAELLNALLLLPCLLMSRLI